MAPYQEIDNAQTGEKQMTNLKETLAASPPRTEQPQVERRRASLPQPDFKHYQKSQAYPGKEYLFVGHSYDAEHEHENADATRQAKREKAIASVLKHCAEDSQWLPIKDAIGDKSFYEMLSRFEQDWLHRLPETVLIGPAIDDHGKLVPQSFTVWRKEMRRRQSEAPRTESSEASAKEAAPAKQAEAASSSKPSTAKKTGTNAKPTKKG
jgi:hypothetical protein